VEKSSSVLPNALRIPALTKLKNKRFILASNSPRRKEILLTHGLAPEIVPSNFPETLPHSTFSDLHEYPVATATHKAVEVYERLVQAQPDSAPSLVIGADTVVLMKENGSTDYILEKPTSKADNLRMLLDMNGKTCEVVTGVALVYPILTSPGYEIKTLDERTTVYFSENPPHLLEAYADSGEGLDRAGGFAIQGLGGLLIAKIDGDYNNVVGLPAASLFRFLDILVEDDDDFLEL